MRPTAILTLVLLALCTADLPAQANGNTPPGEAGWYEDPCADLRARLEKLEAEKAAQERRAAEARKQAQARRKAAAAAAAKRKAAQEAARKAVEPPKPTSADIARDTLDLARNLVEEGRFQTAINVLRTFLKNHPRSADGWYWIARAHHAMGDYDRAQVATNIALEIDPYYPALAKTPSGLEPRAKPTKAGNKEPRPSMSVLPVKQPLPSMLPLEPIVISFPHLVRSHDLSEEEYDGQLRAVDAPHDPNSGAYLRYDPYPPLPRGRSVAWQQSERFQEISRWRFRVDRIGILDEPRVPVAWKGNHPYEVYFWTGQEWARVRRVRKSALDRKEQVDDILLRAKDDIARLLDENNYQWFERDTPSLAANASMMRYWWQGDIDLDGARRRVAQKQKEVQEREILDDGEEFRKKANEN